MEETKAPDQFDRLIGMLHDLPDVVKTKVTPINIVPKFGVGGVQTFLIQTYKHRENGDTVFLKVDVPDKGLIKLILPPKVVDAIVRQRESVSKMMRRKIGRDHAADLKAQGIQPAFMRKKVQA
jgi:hypothetical protein